MYPSILYKIQWSNGCNGACTILMPYNAANPRLWSITQKFLKELSTNIILVCSYSSNLKGNCCLDRTNVVRLTESFVKAIRLFFIKNVIFFLRIVHLDAAILLFSYFWTFFSLFCTVYTQCYPQNSIIYNKFCFSLMNLIVDSSDILSSLKNVL